MNILGKQSDQPFSRKSDHKREKGTVSFMHVQNIICSQTQLDGIAHEQIIICMQLFASHVVGSWPMKRKKKLLRMIISIKKKKCCNNHWRLALVSVVVWLLFSVFPIFCLTLQPSATPQPSSTVSSLVKLLLGFKIFQTSLIFTSLNIWLQ